MAASERNIVKTSGKSGFAGIFSIPTNELSRQTKNSHAFVCIFGSEISPVKVALNALPACALSLKGSCPLLIPNGGLPPSAGLTLPRAHKINLFATMEWPEGQTRPRAGVAPQDKQQKLIKQKPTPAKSTKAGAPFPGEGRGTPPEYIFMTQILFSQAMSVRHPACALNHDLSRVKPAGLCITMFCDRVL